MDNLDNEQNAITEDVCEEYHMYEPDEDGTPRKVDPLSGAKCFIWAIPAQLVLWMIIIGVCIYVW